MDFTPKIIIKYWMALRVIQEYIAQDVNNIARVEDEGNIVSIKAIYSCIPEKEPSNIIIIIHIGLCVSSYYFTIVSDCWLPFCLFTNRPKIARAEFAHA